MSKNNTKKKSYYAFFDAEYTCFMENDKFFDREHSGELLSVGVVICDRSFRLLHTYYSTIRPVYNAVLTGYCRKLTGLTQQEIDRAPSYETVFQEMYLLFQEYPVKEIFTWGNDAHTLLHDMDVNHRNVARRFRRIAGQLTDITKRLTRKVYGKSLSLSLSDMKYICGMEHSTAHNALEDAKDLYRITRCCLQGRYDKERAKKLEEYIQNRDTYHKYKRFKRPLAPESPEEKTAAEGSALDKTAGENRTAGNGKNGPDRRILKDTSLQYIDMLKAYYKKEDGTCPPEILAMCDDIRSLLGMESQDCPRLE